MKDALLYNQHTVALRSELAHALPHDELRAFHVKHGARHLMVAARQFAILALTTWALIAFTNPLVWIPLAFVQGFTVFNFTVLLHEVVHHTIFERPRAGVERALGWLYAVPSGISASQFTRWHLDHHAELGSDEDDPEAASSLSPKINARWFKLLYCSPRCSRSISGRRVRKARRIPRRCSGASRSSAASRSSRTCRARADRQRLRRRRRAARVCAADLFHLPDCVHAQPPRPTLRHRSDRSREVGHADARALVWDFAFLNSNYHLEHHYFVGVPFYRLPALQRALAPFYEHHRMRWQNYSAASSMDGWSRTVRRTPTGRRPGKAKGSAMQWLLVVASVLSMPSASSAQTPASNAAIDVSTVRVGARPLSPNSILGN